MVGSLCTGYSGLEMALALAGMDVELAWVADNDPAASKLLALRHPGVPNLGDVKVADWATQPRVDILTAGYPCQPFSVAGHKKGVDDARHIWPHIRDAIRVLRPGGVLLENVPGHRSRGFGVVLGDLAEIGYVGSWVSVRASDIGAAHRRERVFILAHPADAPRPRLETGRQGWAGERADGLTLLPTPRASANENRQTRPSPAELAGRHGRKLAAEVCALFPTPHANCATGPGGQGRDGGLNLQTAVATLLPTPRATDGTNGGPNQRGRRGDVALPSAVQPERWGVYAEAVARWEAATASPAPYPTEPGPRTGQRLAPVFVEWLMGLDPGHVTDVPDLTRNEQLRLLGNGVVPQQGALALRILSGLAR